VAARAACIYSGGERRGAVFVIVLLGALAAFASPAAADGSRLPSGRTDESLA